jgi:hypothetical protein
MINKKSIWITWESQRRSIELAKALEAKLYILECPANDLITLLKRYAKLSIKTINIIKKEKPKIIFAQNPSIILASLLCFIKKIFNYMLVVDRHSNFKFNKNPKILKWRIFHILSRFSIRNADLTIVTNQFLQKTIDLLGGKGFVLQDKLPLLNIGRKIQLEGERNIIYISSFSGDEPIKEIIKAAKMIKQEWIIFITGNYERIKKADFLSKLPINVKLTGFIEETDYQNLLFSSDLIMVLTNQEYTLNCGAYEAIELEKPLIVSGTKTIKQYFRKGVVFTELDSKSIAQSIKWALANKSVLTDEIVSLKNELQIDWNLKYKKLLKIINR